MTTQERGQRGERMHLFRLTKGLVGQAYQLGEVDCFSVVHDYLQQAGVDLPHEWHGLTRESYVELYQADPVRAKRVMVEFVRDHLDEVQPSRACAGDVLLLELKGSGYGQFLGIHGGNANVVLASDKEGVTVMPLKHYTVKGAWRCQAQP